MTSTEAFPLMSFGFGPGPKPTEVTKLFSCALFFLCQSLQFHHDAIRPVTENRLTFYIVTLTNPESQQKYSSVQPIEMFKCVDIHFSVRSS